MRRHERLPLFAYQKPPGPMPLGDRLSVAAVSVAVAIPPVAIALIVMILVGMGGGFIPWIVWPAFLVLGSSWTYEITSRITQGKVDRYRFSAAAVAIGTMVGCLVGMLVMITNSLLEPPVLGFFGALVGTYVPARTPAPSAKG